MATTTRTITRPSDHDRPPPAAPGPDALERHLRVVGPSTSQRAEEHPKHEQEQAPDAGPRFVARLVAAVRRRRERARRRRFDAAPHPSAEFVHARSLR